MKNNVKNIRQDLIQRELSRLVDLYKGEYKITRVSKCKLSNRLIDKLYNQYYASEHCIFFYDSDPELPSLGTNDQGEKYNLFDMYLDYEDGYYIENEKYDETRLRDISHSGKAFAKDELKNACEELKEICKQYEERRLTFNNWIDVYSRGIWGLSQNRVDHYAKGLMKEAQKWQDLSNRVYSIECIDQKGKKHITLYIYGRDIYYCDYYFSYVQRYSHKRRKRNM